MGAEGKTAIYNLKKIHEEANLRGGIIAEQFGGSEMPFGMYVYLNPFATDPEFLLVTYWDAEHQFSPLGFFEPWEDTEDDFKYFVTMYRCNYRNTSMSNDYTIDELIVYFKFCVWCCQHALIVNWEVWT